MQKSILLNDLVSVMQSEEVQNVESTFNDGVENIDSLLDMKDKVAIRKEELQLQLMKADQVERLIDDKLMQIRKKINARLNN